MDMQIIMLFFSMLYFCALLCMRQGLLSNFQNVALCSLQSCFIDIYGHKYINGVGGIISLLICPPICSTFPPPSGPADPCSFSFSSVFTPFFHPPFITHLSEELHVWAVEKEYRIQGERFTAKMGLNNYQAFFFKLNKRIINICYHVTLFGSTQLWSAALTEMCLLQIKVLITF